MMRFIPTALVASTLLWTTGPAIAANATPPDATLTPQENLQPVPTPQEVVEQNMRAPETRRITIDHSRDVVGEPLAHQPEAKNPNAIGGRHILDMNDDEMPAHNNPPAPLNEHEVVRD